MRISIELDEKQLEILNIVKDLSQKDDPKFIDSIFTVGLMDTARFFAKQERSVHLLELMNEYMTRCLLGTNFTVQDLLEIWENEK